MSNFVSPFTPISDPFAIREKREKQRKRKGPSFPKHALTEFFETKARGKKLASNGKQVCVLTLDF